MNGPTIKEDITILPSVESQPEDVTGHILRVIEKILGEIPPSDEGESPTPKVKAQQLIRFAAIKAAGVSGTLALPPGPLGLLTILPDLLTIWRIQAQLVSDIASVYGKSPKLTPAAMLYCLFRHAAAQAVRDLVVRVGERIIVKRPALRVLQSILQRIGVKITQRLAGRGIARLLPILGALGVAGYAYYDTGQVGQTAIEFFSKEIDLKESTD